MDSNTTPKSSPKRRAAFQSSSPSKRTALAPIHQNTLSKVQMLEAQIANAPLNQYEKSDLAFDALKEAARNQIDAQAEIRTKLDNLSTKIDGMDARLKGVEEKLKLE
ncbi:hypothetical protein G7Y79_00035g070240 [Physcia stellaris]|nr:hypothetical protein G7Y79_00035g070240 [Physcia stellaris]